MEGNTTPTMTFSQCFQNIGEFQTMLNFDVYNYRPTLNPVKYIKVPHILHVYYIYPFLYILHILISINV